MNELDASFRAVPNDSDGEPLLATYDAVTFEAYIDWLADYLYRPSRLATSAVLPLEEAWSRVSAIESEIAFWIWDHPFEDYPPRLTDACPKHADYPHRVELSHVISRVPAKEDRVELMRRFYQALSWDSAK